jgi:hypothetical protein
MGSAVQLLLPLPFAVLVVAITLGMLALEVFLTALPLIYLLVR